MTATEIGIGARWVATLVILTIVWRHSHWSVALSITGMTLALELHWFAILKR